MGVIYAKHHLSTGIEAPKPEVPNQIRGAVLSITHLILPHLWVAAPIVGTLDLGALI
jgi:hypothetical protein